MIPTTHHSDDIQLAEHFWLSEFEASQVAARHDIDNSVARDLRPCSILRNLVLLSERVLQPARDAFGTVVVTSGYRCLPLNKLVGSDDSSQHPLGQAADIVVPGVPVLQVCEWISAHCKFDKLIHEFGEWCHVSAVEYDPRKEVLTSYRKGKGPSAVVAYKPGLIEMHQLNHEVNHETTNQ